MNMMLRKFMRSELEKYTDEIIQDRLGSIFGVKRGEKTGQRLWSQAIWMKLDLWSLRLLRME